MISKSKRRLLQLLGFIIGLLFGLWRPQQVQLMLPVLGISVGIGYFLLSKVTINKHKDLSEIRWFIPIQMIMYFIIGGAIGSSIYLYMELY
ncbi:hypothetical protein [Marinilactibacillus psychrotolerans]|uniref:hypothetical protein n=1 Tax=Marinilactibacillus psychrotolerans TaxID=191770 RepID=UPI00388A03F5